MSRFKKLWYSIVARELVGDYLGFIQVSKSYEESLTEEIDELEQEVEKLRKQIYEYKRHPRGLGTGIWYVGENIVANIRGEFNEYYHTWMRVRQGEFDFGE
jgi:sugar-specific transcriptional regulator TrmB